MSIYLEELVEESVHFIFVRLDGSGGGGDQLVGSLTVLQLSAGWPRADLSPDITNHHLANHLFPDSPPLVFARVVLLLVRVASRLP